MSLAEHELRPPSTPAEWEAYHSIRRRVLFEARGRFGVYDADHPDEHAAGNHPMLLFHDGDPVGVVRMDVVGDDAFMRRVAIEPTHQRRGNGRALIELAESFAREQGCATLRANVDPAAVAFYAKCGFGAAGPSLPSGSVPMEKSLAQ